MFEFKYGHTNNSNYSTSFILPSCNHQSEYSSLFSPRLLEVTVNFLGLSIDMSASDTYCPPNLLSHRANANILERYTFRKYDLPLSLIFPFLDKRLSESFPMMYFCTYFGYI